MSEEEILRAIYSLATKQSREEVVKSLERIQDYITQVLDQFEEEGKEEGLG